MPQGTQVTDGTRMWESLEVTMDSIPILAALLWGVVGYVVDGDYVYPTEYQSACVLGMLVLGCYVVWNEDEIRLIRKEQFKQYFSEELTSKASLN